MKNHLMDIILQRMLPYLDNSQLNRLKETLEECLQEVPIPETALRQGPSNQELLLKFLDAKRVEGCSPRTVKLSVRSPKTV